MNTILSKRQFEIVILIASGLPNKQIATELKISESTVEKHRTMIGLKLCIQLGLQEIGKANITRYAIESGLIKCDSHRRPWR